MRVTILGNSDFTIACARGLLHGGATVDLLITMPAERRPLNSTDLAGFAHDRSCAYWEVDDINSEQSLSELRRHRPEYVLSTWPRLLSADFLRIPSKFVIGTHPTPLPKCRGRHPLHWMITLGIAETTLSFFRMDEGIDSGPVLFQTPFTLGARGDIVRANAALCEAGYNGAASLAGSLARGDITLREQDHTLATTWRAKTPHDVTIDPRMSVEDIELMVRSYLPPFPGANLIVSSNRVCKVIGARRESIEEPWAEPGKILKRAAGLLIMKAADGVVGLQLAQDVLVEAAYLYPPGYYIARNPAIAHLLS